MSNSKSALFQTNALFTFFAREEGLHQYMNKTKHIHWCDVFPNLVAEYEVLNLYYLTKKMHRSKTQYELFNLLSIFNDCQAQI